MIAGQSLSGKAILDSSFILFSHRSKRSPWRLVVGHVTLEISKSVWDENAPNNSFNPLLLNIILHMYNEVYCSGEELLLTNLCFQSLNTNNFTQMSHKNTFLIHGLLEKNTFCMLTYPLTTTADSCYHSPLKNSLCMSFRYTQVKTVLVSLEVWHTVKILLL